VWMVNNARVCVEKTIVLLLVPELDRPLNHLASDRARRVVRHPRCLRSKRL
jgi:hypothetical protein